MGKEKALNRATKRLSLLQARRRRREAMVKGLQETFERLQLYTDGIKPFAEDEATAQILHKHLLKGVGAESVDFLLLYQEVRCDASQPFIEQDSEVGRIFGPRSRLMSKDR